MPNYFDIYQHHADQYDALVEREDYQHLLLQALNQIVLLRGTDVVEFGAGTGRLTCLLAPLARSIHAFDSSQTMLDVAAEKLGRMGTSNWQLKLGDHRSTDAPSARADVAISGWSMCYLALETGRVWRMDLERGLHEMWRVLRPGGTRIIIETLGTGHETPEPPANLKDYFACLETAGFQHTWIRTDYLFQNVAEAETLTRFFFGEDMIARIRNDKDGIILPECTGIWWQKIALNETSQ